MQTNGTITNGTVSNTSNGGTLVRDEQAIIEQGDSHFSSSLETPMRAGAFDLSDKEKIAQIEKHFREIMDVLGLDLNDDSLSGTPYRVAKMYVEEIFSGLDPKKAPNAKVFENKYNYGEMLVEKDITLFSTCEHHFLPIVGKAHVAYISNGTVIGLSKINRMVEYYSKRPQVQERLNLQIAEGLQSALGTEDVAVLIDSKHLCVSSRGIQDVRSTTVTSEYRGKFKEENVRREFLNYLNLKVDF